MKLFLQLILMLAIMSCGNSKKATNKKESDTKTEEVSDNVKQAILSQDIGKFRNSESYNILAVSLEENILQLDITYSGGCKEHKFELVGSAFIMKSSPPKRGIQLYHHKHDDDCRELVNDRLFFDISQFAYGNKEIILNLHNYPEAIRYTKKPDEIETD